MNIVQTVAPTQEPITLDEAKLFMHILEDDENTLIETMIAAAREYAENYTNRQLELATFELTTDCFIQDFTLPKTPVQSITKIEYMDTDGNYQILDSADYYLYYENEIAKIYFESIPSYKMHKQALKITFTAGYTTTPKSIKTYMKMLVSTMYENREAYVIGARVETKANPMLDKMLDFFRVRPI